MATWSINLPRVAVLNDPLGTPITALALLNTNVSPVYVHDVFIRQTNNATPATAGDRFLVDVGILTGAAPEGDLILLDQSSVLPSGLNTYRYTELTGTLNLIRRFGLGGDVFAVGITFLTQAASVFSLGQAYHHGDDTMQMLTLNKNEALVVRVMAAAANALADNPTFIDIDINGSANVNNWYAPTRVRPTMVLGG